MEVQVRGNGVAITDGLLEYINRRAARLDHLVERAMEAKVELRALRHKTGPETTSAQITFRSGKDLLRAEERGSDPKQAVDQAIQKLERQIRRVHDKRSRRSAAGQPSIRAASAVSAPDAMSDEMDADLDADEVGELVRVKRFGVKPMDVEEAMEQMELLGHDFFLFHLAEEDIPSVVYRRRDGSFGLLIPREG